MTLDVTAPAAVRDPPIFGAPMEPIITPSYWCVKPTSYNIWVTNQTSFNHGRDFHCILFLRSPVLKRELYDALLAHMEMKRNQVRLKRKAFRLMSGDYCVECRHLQGDQTFFASRLGQRYRHYSPAIIDDLSTVEELDDLKDDDELTLTADQYLCNQITAVSLKEQYSFRVVNKTDFKREKTFTCTFDLMLPIRAWDLCANLAKFMRCKPDDIDVCQPQGRSKKDGRFMVLCKLDGNDFGSFYVDYSGRRFELDEVEDRKSYPLDEVNGTILFLSKQSKRLNMVCVRKNKNSSARRRKDQLCRTL